MNMQTSWIKPPRAAKGQDHLGTHAPCIALYSRFLPGITNVTPRARYYSLYTWLVWAFDRRYKDADSEKFEQVFRKADCLLTLIAERHAKLENDGDARHSASMTGTTTLAPALAKLKRNDVLRLSDFATRDEVDSRYFQSRLGGLDQYYIGTLQDLEVLHSAKDGWIRYTPERGRPLAEAVDAYVDGDQFFETVESDRVSIRRLDDLNRFCLCHLPRSVREHALLKDVFFESGAYKGGDGQRRLTLALALAVIDASPRSDSDPVFDLEFARAVYCRSFGADRPWKIPERLEATADMWRLYVRNELLSLSTQAIFAVGLKQLKQSELRFGAGRDFEVWMADSKFAGRIARRLGNGSFGDAVRKQARSSLSIEDSANPRHEWARSKRILAGFSTQPDNEADEARVVESLELLISLAARQVHSDAYAVSPFTRDFLATYPVNLQSFVDAAMREWQELPMAKLLGWLMNRWGIEAHLTIALRKLRQSRQSTFRIRPTERGFDVDPEIPPPTRTNFRMGSGLQILRDLGAIADSDDGSSLTPFGKRVLREVIDG